MFATARCFRLSTRMQENGVGCDADGVFIGPVALLERGKVKDKSCLACTRLRNPLG